jgi:hypothetical protein
VDKDILGGISRFAKRKTLHYGIWIVTFSKNIDKKIFHDSGYGECVV